MIPLPSLTISDYTARAREYCRMICAKERPASRYTRLACQRFLDDMNRDDWRWAYDEKRAHKVCRFCEMYPHEKGPKQDQPLQLEDFQCWLVCNIFGFVDQETRFRRFREAVLLIPRKNGKSPLAAAIAVYMAFFDGEKGSEVYTGALTEKQAWEVFRPAKAMLERLPKLCAKYGIIINAKSIEQPSTRSRFMPVIGKGRDGSMPHLFIGDESHQWVDASLYDAMSTGMVGRSQPLKLIISTAGDTIEGPCYNKQKDVEAMLDGDIPNERLFGVVYTADPDLLWTSYEALVSANPNLGVSVGLDYLEETRDEAIRNAGKQGTFRCKHLNHWVTSSSAWMNMERFRACEDPTLKEEQFLDDDCVLSSDLASMCDLACTAKVFRRDIDGKKHYYCFVRSYAPLDRIQDPSYQHYARWHGAGYLTACEGGAIDFIQLGDDTVKDIERYKVKVMSYDERYAREYAQRVAAAVKVEQVIIPPTVASFSPAMKEVEAAVLDGRFHYATNPMVPWSMGNVESYEHGGTGNLTNPVKPKGKNDLKIDPAVAIFLGVNRAMLWEAPKKKLAQPFWL